ncbi:MAG: hypothetical protein MJ252_02745 [archaeon]|nr:hypothetical protein [archaeon]
MDNDDSGKIIKAFCVVGLSDKLSKYDEEIESQYIDNIDIIENNLESPETNTIPKKEGKEIWKRLNRSNFWLRISYTDVYSNPITDIRIETLESATLGFMYMPANKVKEGYKLLTITKSKDLRNDQSFPEVKNTTDIEIDDGYGGYLIPDKFNLLELLNLETRDGLGKVILVTRAHKTLPLKSINEVNDLCSKYPFQFEYSPSPYNLKYMPELIDSYPINSVNPSIGMFCFPKGISFAKIMNMPSWFSFILTDESGKRTFGSCLLLSEEVGDLQRKIVPKFECTEKYYVDKAICILSNEPFFYNCQIFLRELYRIQVSQGTTLPLERAICHFVDSIYIPSYEKFVSFSIAEEEIKFFKIPIYGEEWDTNHNYICTLIKFLSFENIITAFEALLLERKLVLKCCSKQVLLHISLALTNLIFPFKWIHVLIPVLPEKIKIFLESPVPFLIGINNFMDSKEFPSDCIILNIDENRFDNYNEKMPPLPQKLLNHLLNKRLAKVKSKFKNVDKVDRNEEEILQKLDAAFAFEEDDQNIVNGKEFDTCEIRDIFFEFFVNMFKNWDSYFTFNKKHKDENEPVVFNREAFLKDHSSQAEDSFLYEFSETAIFTQFVDSFQNLSTTNSCTSFFVEAIQKKRGKSKYYLPYKEPSIGTVTPQIKIDDLLNKKFYYSYFPRLNPQLYSKTDIPKKTYKSRFMYSFDEWCYNADKLMGKDWPKFLLYSIYELWFTFFSFIIYFYNDTEAKLLMDYALCLVEDLKRKKIIPTKNLYTKLIKACGRKNLNSYMKEILTIASSDKNKKYNSLFQNAFMNGLYSMTETMEDKKGEGSLAILDSIGRKSSAKQIGDILNSKIEETFDPSSMDDIKEKIEKCVFITYELCPFCLKEKKNKTNKIKIEEILAGFSKKKSSYSSICPSCLNKIFPKLYFLFENQKILDTEFANFLSPIVLIKEVDNIIKNHGEKFFFTKSFYNDSYMRHVFWNLVFFFNLFDLPFCIMYLEKDPMYFSNLSSKMEEMKERKDKRILKHGKTADYGTADTAKKVSSTSYDKDNMSVSGRSGVSAISHLDENEKALWDKIQARMEKNSTSVMMSRTAEKTLEARSDINARIYDMKAVISKVIEKQVKNMKIRLENFLTDFGESEKISEKGSSFKFSEKEDNQEVEIENFEKEGKVEKIKRFSITEEDVLGKNKLKENKEYDLGLVGKRELESPQKNRKEEAYDSNDESRGDPREINNAFLESPKRRKNYKPQLVNTRDPVIEQNSSSKKRFIEDSEEKILPKEEEHVIQNFKVEDYINKEEKHTQEIKINSLLRPINQTQNQSQLLQNSLKEEDKKEKSKAEPKKGFFSFSKKPGNIFGGGNTANIFGGGSQNATKKPNVYKYKLGKK